MHLPMLTSPSVATGPTVPCNRCGTPVPIEADALAWAPSVACDACVAAYDAALAQEARQAATGRLRERWEDLCPERYRAPIDAARHRNFHAAAYQRAMAWRWEARGGLMLVGSSGTGKTRTLWRLVAREVAAGRSIKVFTGQAFAHEAADAAREARERAWHRELGREIDLVCLDDLGNHRFTPTLESSLFDLIETRMAHLRPLILTSNYAPHEFAAQFRPENQRLASAVIRRLAEFCGPDGIVEFNAPPG